MPLPQEYRYAVAFVTADREGEDGRMERRPVGTAFIVQVSGSRLGGHRLLFVVTAAHIIRRLDPGNVYVRLHRKVGQWTAEPGEIEDVRVNDWALPDDPADDVAAAPLDLEQQAYYVRAIPFSVDEPDPRKARYAREPLLGERVHFLGLLRNVEAMGEANVPMLRTGALGALSQRGVPLRVGPGTTLRVDAHLVDCFSHRGFSGSPVFRQYEEYKWDRTNVSGHDVVHLKPETRTPFFGIMVGHFPIRERGRVTDQGRELEFDLPVNAGVGVVLPTKVIRQTLNLPELIEVGRRWCEKLDS